MELKSLNAKHSVTRKPRFNRTFMELKYLELEGDVLRYKF